MRRPGRARSGVALVALLLAAALTWLWQKTRSFDPEEHARVDSALRELRSLDRTINQDVLRARYQLIGSYDPVRLGYRRIEELEQTLARPPRFLDEGAQRRLTAALDGYRAAVTVKQGLIEEFKYRAADLIDLLGYLPGAGAGVASAASVGGDERLAASVNHVLQQALLYNLTSEEKHASIVEAEVNALAAAGQRAGSYLVRRRVRTLALNIHALLKVKPLVDRLLLRIFEQPVVEHEETIARTYYAGYADAERVARRYRIVLYGLAVALVLVVAYAVRRLQQTARALAAANERLEERVAERTRELAVRNREMRTVLDNVEQALFTVDLDGRLSQERSAALDRWFPHAAPGAHLGAVLEPVDENAAAWVNMGWPDLRDGVLPPDVVLGQLPTRVAFRGRHYQIGYRPIGDGAAPDKVLLVITDVTEAALRAQVEVEQKEQLVVFQHLLRDRAGFLESYAEWQRLAERALASAARARDRGALFRAVHTLKASAAGYGIASVAAACHEVESRLAEGSADELTAAERALLGEAWAAFAGRVRALTGAAPEDQAEVSRADLGVLAQAITRGRSAAELLRLVADLEREPAARRLERVGEEARSLVRRLGKGELEVITEADDVRFDRRRWAPFWAALVHVVRNAVDHGIEPADERAARGKPRAGRLWLRVAREPGGGIVVEVRDDGRGIDWEALRARARDQGLPYASEADLREALFRGGVSTAREVTDVSGRGAGVSACGAVCRELGGTVSLQTTPGEGTSFRFHFRAVDPVGERRSPAAVEPAA